MSKKKTPARNEGAIALINKWLSEKEPEARMGKSGELTDEELESRVKTWGDLERSEQSSFAPPAFSTRMSQLSADMQAQLDRRLDADARRRNRAGRERDDEKARRERDQQRDYLDQYYSYAQQAMEQRLGMVQAQGDQWSYPGGTYSPTEKQRQFFNEQRSALSGTYDVPDMNFKSIQPRERPQRKPPARVAHVPGRKVHAIRKKGT